MKKKENITNRSLQKTLLELLETKKFEKITVNDICVRAKISRTAFYDYYLDKFDLLLKSMDQLRIDHTVEFQNNHMKIEDIVHSIISNISANKKIFYNIYSSRDVDEIRSIHEESFRKRILFFIENTSLKIKSDMPVDVIAILCCSGVVIILRSWILMLNSYSEEEIIEFLVVYLYNNIID
ncbi:hypothetical protein A5821_002984 [Enterococcus sp. 7F3_DIV0205]|uniref:HTH tetR-type domain-containing protein n=1 Tax=Candidatus Enterococcus palustris TaxID=1834189 RepID=A0AAQ3WAZ9_9ENTE|nr:TetR/AcrR family transcriptional regulator [Enterococcus sp. 7F3_DIV0205]OTN83418.1 hypothetical protein A5821_003341 [Enterococcus sp. 7F3_DIV0205]